MIHGRLLLLCALAAVPAWPQEQQRPLASIHGVVKEIGLGGLAAAEVTAYEFAGPERQKTAVAATVTDGSGGFHFDLARFGDYWIEVKKQAYVASIPVEGLGSLASLASQKPRSAETGTLITVNPTHPSQEVRLALMRPGGLTGTVVDEDDKPLANMLVEVSMAGASVLSRGTAITDKNGVFSIDGLMPGDHVVKVSQRATKFAAALPQPPKEDLETVDEDLETTFWPGASDEASAGRVRVNPGAMASVGTVRLRKTPSYRVKLKIEGCQAGNLPSLTIMTPNYGAVPALLGTMALTTPPFGARIASCDDTLVRGLKPGSYTFELANQSQWGEARVEIGNKNSEVTIALASGFDIAGRLVMAGDAPLPKFDMVKVQLPWPVTAPDAQGMFAAKGLLGSDHRVDILGLGDQYYVKEIRVDGSAAPEGNAHLYPGSKLEVVLDDHPASISGSVTEGGEAFGQPLVFLVKWPSLLEAIPQPITGDNDGKFQIGGLEPGEYRVLAVPSTALPDGEQVKLTMLGRLWDQATRVTLERGATKAIDLKLSDPLP